MSNRKNEDEIENILTDFIKELDNNTEYKLIPLPPDKTSCENYEYNIYNEISLQHELGKYIENLGYKVLYEKNMYDNKKKELEKDHDWVKKEVDLVIIKGDEKYAIELKFSKGENARTPENMYDFIKDIRFMEQVKEYRKFKNVYNFIIANSQKYYNSELNKNESTCKYNIYGMFRKETVDKNNRKYFIPRHPDNKEQRYCKPTGKEKGVEFVLSTEYSGKWEILLSKDQNVDEEIFQYRYILINHDN